MIEVPVQTAEIFEILSKGQFICSNSSDKKTNTLFKVIEEEDNYELLYNYFRNINFTLEKGDEYFYFSRIELKADLERKLENAFRWIDIVDFFQTYNHSFTANFRFTPFEILAQLNIDAELDTKLNSLKKYATGKEKPRDILEAILNSLQKESFIEIENEITHQYKVLSSYKYLEQLILAIHIPEDAIDEIS